MSHIQHRRTRVVMAPLAILALLASASVASAHVENYSQAKALQAGPYLVFFDLQPTTPFAENAISLVAQISDAATGTSQRNVPTSILVAGPGNFSERKTMESDGTGYMVASLAIPERGNYSVRIFVKDVVTNETHAADSEFEVFPNIPYRIRPVDQSADVITGQRVPLAFEIVDPISLAPKYVADLSVKLEHWSDDHTSFLGASDAPATRVANGVWRIEPIFAQTGMYHIRFASEAGGFNYGDVPLLHVYAISPLAASGEEKESPGAGPLALLAMVGIAAILVRRR